MINPSRDDWAVRNQIITDFRMAIDSVESLRGKWSCILLILFCFSGGSNFLTYVDEHLESISKSLISYQVMSNKRC